MVDIEIVEDYVPGALGGVVALHGTYYAQHWGFGQFFEARVARDLAEFLARYDADRDGFWTVSAEGRTQASIAIDGIRADTHGAHLRWFIVSDVLRGSGVGGRLMRTAMEFCRGKGYSRVHLDTFAGLDAARHLYEREGFRLTEEHPGAQWGAEVLEQRFECLLD